MKKQLTKSFEEVIAAENLLAAWREFLVGKTKKADVQAFARHLIDNILQLRDELANGTYQHGGYKSFYVFDPKPRHIHKASVRDRLLHHAVHRVLYPFFDRTFASHSFSCRTGKGTHPALYEFDVMARKVSHNFTRTCWVLKGDVRKFFDSIDHTVLVDILRSYIPEVRLMSLLQNIIESYSSGPSRGLPLGNLTSQLFVNAYTNEFDQFVKHRLKMKYYIRYADDFVLFSQNRDELASLVEPIRYFLGERLRLTLHPEKTYLKTVGSGVDFLGWVHFPHYRVLRTATKHRMFRRLHEHPTKATFQSYKGLLTHGDAYTLGRQLINEYWLLRGV
ncbi:hypothetical protein A3I40_01980 [Candidatus Uhrbacteria bacterium RIFCSPLOWO2_02_FULL_48_12]|uniref:Reverse transcriptase domain-containing protein n=1 Tax=Candidatus Uhrbacteria bacterium RIFCSPLOWO2_02_FULL_48_12 TaxID=1802407 RepID=A0A1F7V9V3_9BACT|nr:MAG: hypothetical protein A3I40_01980 [Candidatus Uhrbacteria bacterium RIFCSPLOWO2_02_FULL_48_12]